MSLPDEHALVKAIELRDKALKEGAHQKILDSIENRIARVAKETNDRISAHRLIFDNMSESLDGTKDLSLR